MDLTPGTKVVVTMRDLRDDERAVEVDAVVDRVSGEHVWIRVGGAGRMCVALRAVRVAS